VNLINKTFGNITDKLRGSSLKAKAARGSLVLAIGTFVERGMRLVRNMILARLLAPEDFGLMAIVLAVLVFLESLTDAGVYQAIIHSKKGADQKYLNVAWVVQLTRGLGLYIIAFLLAPSISHFYNNPELVALLRATFLFVVFSCFVNPGVYVLEKELQYTKLMFLMQGSTFLGTILTIGLALYSNSVWVLVIGRVAESVIRCICSFVFCSFRPRLHIDRKCLYELVAFSRGMLGLSFLTIITLHADVFVLGKYISTERLGMYALAISLSQQPALIVRQIIIRVLFPVFSIKQEDKQFLCKTVGKVIRATVIFGVPSTIFVALFSAPILTIIYGQKYALMANTFSILFCVMLFRLQGNILSKVYMAVGQPHMHRRFMVLLTILVGSLLVPGAILLGTVGVALVLFFSNFAAVCMQIIWLQKLLGRELIRSIFTARLLPVKGRSIL